MNLQVPSPLLREIHACLERAYPEEAAGILLGRLHEPDREAVAIYAAANQFEAASRERRYRIDPRDLLAAEERAEADGLEIVGVFHSHPDHPARPSETDRAWALPWYVYLITRVTQDGAAESRAWTLEEDRGAFSEVAIVLRAPSSAAGKEKTP